MELLDILRSNSGLITPPRSRHWGKPCLQSQATSLFEVAFYFILFYFLSSWEGNISPSRRLNGALALFSLILITLTFFFPHWAQLYVLCLAFFNLIPPWFCLRDTALLFLQPSTPSTYTNIITFYSFFRSQLSYHLLGEHFPSPQTGWDVLLIYVVTARSAFPS